MDSNLDFVGRIVDVGDVVVYSVTVDDYEFVETKYGCHSPWWISGPMNHYA